MIEDELARQRAELIAKKQALREAAVTDMQAAFVGKLLDSVEKITTNPAVLNKLFADLLAGPLFDVLQEYVLDIQEIGAFNFSYFDSLLESEQTAEIIKINKKVQVGLRERLGLSPNGTPAKDGFLDLFIKDTSIQLQAKSFVYKAKSMGKGPDFVEQGLRTIIEGDTSQTGAYQRHFNRYIYDTYQQNDAEIQETYAQDLQLQAALYAGTQVKGTRPFCKERKGKVFIRAEIAQWSNLNWAGKNNPYNPFIDRGGYGCRDHFNWITNKMALRRREDLQEINGTLKLK